MLTLEQQDAQAELQHQEEDEPPIHNGTNLGPERIAKRRKNLLPAKVNANSLGSLFYRADYELRWLRVAKRQRNAWCREFSAADTARDIATMSICSKHLLDWCERERAILRISKPAASAVKERKGQVPQAVIEG